MTLDIFVQAERTPNARALVTAEQSLGYAKLAAHATRAASALDALGYLGSDRMPLALVVRPTLPSLAWLFAAFAYGVPVLLVSPRTPGADRPALAARARAPALFAPDETPWPSSERSLPPRPSTIDPARPLVLVPTSGSSGRPKLVVLSRAAVVAAADASARNLPLGAEDTWLLCLPPSHVGGLGIVTRCLAAGATIAALDPGETGLLRSLDALVRRLESDRVTLVSLVPAVLDALLSERPDWRPPATLRAVLLGGAATPPALLESAHERGLPVLTTYGLSEACSQVTTTPAGTTPLVASGVVSSGRALSGTEVRVDADERIYVRGPTLFSGYADEPSPLDADGWLRTDDRGRLDAEGNLYVLGRVSERIVTGGENVDPARVEAVLGGAPGVVEACVFGVPDGRFGEIVACALVANASFTPEPFLDHVAHSLAAHERPRRLARLAELPRLPNGKLDRRRCREIALPLLREWR